MLFDDQSHVRDSARILTVFIAFGSTSFALADALASDLYVVASIGAFYVDTVSDIVVVAAAIAADNGDISDVKGIQGSVIGWMLLTVLLVMPTLMSVGE